MPDKRITELPVITYDQVNSVDVLHVGQTTADKRITLPLTKKYVLGNKTIGGNAAGDIVTTNGTQTLSGKRINSLKLNSDTAITTDSNEINLLDGLTAQASLLNILDGATVTTALINRLTGLTANIKTSLDSRIVRYSTALKYILPFKKAITPVATIASITSALLLTYHGLSGATYVVDPDQYMNVTIWKADGNNRVMQSIFDITLTCSANGTGMKVDSIDIDGLSGGTDYVVYVGFYIAPIQNPV